MKECQTSYPRARYRICYPFHIKVVFAFGQYSKVMKNKEIISVSNKLSFTSFVEGKFSIITYIKFAHFETLVDSTWLRLEYLFSTSF